MQKRSIDAVIRQLFERADNGHNAADTVVGGHERILRQTVIALREGAELGEHESPGEATIYVIKVRCVWWQAPNIGTVVRVI